MNLSRLLCVNGGVALHSHGHRSFQLIQPNPPWYLVRDNPVEDPAPPTALDFDPAPAAGSVRDGRPERVMLWMLLGLVVVALLCCGFGVQRISHVRVQNRLGQQVRERELAIQRLTQAYRALETSVAIRVAQNNRPQTKLPIIAGSGSRKTSTRS